jgi:transcriptional regulator with XRE-family HTH domain
MDYNADIFWENVKKEIKLENSTQEWVAKKAGISFNTLQGWISKAIYPRANEAVRIAAVLDTSVEYLFRGAVKNNTKAIEIICRQLPQMYECLNSIQEAVKKIK